MTRLALRIAAGTVVVLVVTSLLIRWGVTVSRDHLTRALPALLTSIDHARERLDRAPAQRLEQVAARVAEGAPQPLRLAPITDPALPAEVGPRARRGAPTVQFTRHQGWRLFFPVRGGSHLLVVGPLQWKAAREQHPAGLILLAVLATIALTAVVVAAPIVRRVRRLERTARRISAGELGARADVSSRDALGHLARGFNSMADRVQELLSSQRELLQAVSHELKTPVARLRFGLEMLAEAETDAERTRRAQGLEQDVDELDRLLQELLFYIRAGDRTRSVAPEPVDIAAELGRLVEQCRPLRPEIAVQIAESSVDLPAIAADPALFRRAIQNLLTNAVRHAEGRVTVSAERAEGGVAVTVSDDGPGIPAAERERVLEPFVRLDRSRSRRSGGAGLGLAIVQRILAAHGGRVEIGDAPAGGAALRTWWPTSAPEPAPAADEAS